MAEPARERADACPGTLTTHAANDGALARIRTPGGTVQRHQLRALADCAEQLGDGQVHLTSRANVQLRAVSDPPRLARALDQSGLLPAPAHERVRNILASPLTGVVGDMVDVRPLCTALDEAICADPDLASLPGRFQFALDDGRGDLPMSAVDVGWHALDAGGGAFIAAGADTGVRVPAGHAVTALVIAARAFLALRAAHGGNAWHLREVDADGRQVAATVHDELRTRVGPVPPVAVTTPGTFPTSGPPATGVHPHHTGDQYIVIASATFGVLTAAHLRKLAELARQAVVFTPWRSVVLPGLARVEADHAGDQLGAAGLVLDPASPAHGVTACIGAPGCASSAADVRADAERAIPDLSPGVRVHVSGCSRRCGHPHSEHVDAVATGQGYAVNGSVVSADALASTIAATPATGHPAERSTQHREGTA